MHFAKECKENRGNITRAAVLENLDIPDEWYVVSVDQDEPDSDVICVMSEEEARLSSLKAQTIIESYPYEEAFMLTVSSWRPQVELTDAQKNCHHLWQHNDIVPTGKERCTFCKFLTVRNMRIFCGNCEITACPMCAKHYVKEKVKPVQSSLKVFSRKDSLIKELLQYIDYLQAENERLQKQVSKLNTQLEETEQQLESERTKRQSR